MRKNPTPSEKLLWEEVRGSALGFRIHRQRVVLGYIADFYCAMALLIIEIDGGYHAERRNKDRVRDANLARCGFHTLRIPASECFKDMKSVKALIVKTVESRTPRVLEHIRGRQEIKRLDAEMTEAMRRDC